MAVEAAFASVLSAATSGLLLSVLVERLLEPVPDLKRPWQAWAVHTGCWLLVYAALLLPLGRPWFAAAGTTAFLLLLVLVNNAKMKALREPFVFQDYEYFTDAIRHPRLYIPFLGWPKLIAAVAGFTLAVAIGLWGEAVPVLRVSWSGQLGAVGLLLAVAGGLLLAVAAAPPLPVGFSPGQDVTRLGLLASLWRYGEEDRSFPAARSPFSIVTATPPSGDLPHLVAVQSESFFDPRSLYPGIRRRVLENFDRLRDESLARGRLAVPAWGANTVRSEFAFLSGVDETGLGGHRFNPYRAIAAGWEVSSLASFLKQLGYRTVCIHPYPASFYRRDRVYPRFGFDEFWDIRLFQDGGRFGPYIGDAAVAEKIASALDGARGPVFVFAITMENHGPLHLESVAASDIQTLYTEPPPAGCEDLTIYLRHLQNADRMIGRLHQLLMGEPRPAGLCWFGDHVPIMPSVYERFGMPDGMSEFLLWSNRDRCARSPETIPAHRLAMEWLYAMKLATRESSQ